MIKRPLCLAAVLLIGVQLLFAGGDWKRAEESPPLASAVKDGDTVTLSGTVFRREERTDYRIYYLTDNQVCLKNQIIYESKILVYIKQHETQKSEKQKEKKKNKIAVGNRIRLTGEITFFEPASNPGNFDRKAYYEKQDMHASVWCDEAEVTDASVWRIREGLTGFRERWKCLLTEKLGEYYGNSMSAILLGDKSGLDEGAKELYQKSGIGHILAISGLHMSFLGIGLYQLLRRAGMSFLSAGLAGILFLLFYTVMIGGGISARRALIMFMVRVGADMTGRDYDLATSLALAAALLVFRQPLYLFDAGFLLSFGALVGIAAVNPVMEKMQILPKAFRASAAIHLVLLPILLYYYFEIPAFSLFLNLLVIPLMSAVLGAGVFGSLLSVFWSGGGTVVLQICKWILWGYEQAAQFTMELPFGRIVTGQPEKWWCLFYYVLLFGGCAVIGKVHTDKVKNKRTEIVGGCLVFLYSAAFCLGCMLNHRKFGELEVTAIDVGQGDGLYVRTPAGKHYLIDGGSTSESQVGQYRIEPFLKSQGVGKLDYVFVSHGDADHINGIGELLSNQEMGIRIDTIVFPAIQVFDEHLSELAELAEKSGTKTVTMECGQQISDGETILTCLAPSAEYTGEIGNASSMVLELDYKEFEMLFTGDLEGEGEQDLMKSGQLGNYDVLKAGHHGSKNSTSEKLLEQIQPEIVVISAGKKNRYGHPHKETLKRLQEKNCHVYSTQKSGAVTVLTDGKRLWIEEYLKR